MNESVKGRFLVASPSLVTPFFSQTVILMFEHNEDGAMGVVLNRPTEATVSDIAEQVFSSSLDWDKSIHLGGPVPGPLLIIHGEEHLADQKVIDGVYSTVDPAKVEALLRAREDPCVIIANYSGWGPGQLEGEMAEDSWLTLPATDALVFSQDGTSMWDRVLSLIRGAQLQEMFGIGLMPADPNVN